MSELWDIRYQKEYQGDHEHRLDTVCHGFFALPPGTMEQYAEAVKALCQEATLWRVEILDARYIGKVTVEETQRYLTDHIFTDEKKHDDIIGDCVLGWIRRWYDAPVDEKFFCRESERFGICGSQNLRGIANVIESRLVGE